MTNFTSIDSSASSLPDLKAALANAGGKLDGCRHKLAAAEQELDSLFAEPITSTNGTQLEARKQAWRASIEAYKLSIAAWEADIDAYKAEIAETLLRIHPAGLNN